MIRDGENNWEFHAFNDTSRALTPQELLWELTFHVDSVHTGLQNTADEMYANLAEQDATKLNLYEREVRADQEMRYWELQEQLERLKKYQDDLLLTIGRVETGEASEEEIASFLPVESEKEELSKRRRAIQREKEKIGVCQHLIDAELIMTGNPGPGNQTDPRRIASGRNRHRLVSGQGVSTFDAGNLFFEVTADTHGGKSRKPGKGAKSYVGQSGKRIRKF